MMKIIGEFSFESLNPDWLPTLWGEGDIHCAVRGDQFVWYALQKATGGACLRKPEQSFILDQGRFYEFGDTVSFREIPLEKYKRFKYKEGNIIGVTKGGRYAFFDLEKNTLLFEGEDDDGVDDLCFYSPDVHIYKEYKRLVARNNQGEKLWEKSFYTSENGGTPHKYISNNDNSLFLVEVGFIDHDEFLVIKPNCGEIIQTHIIDRGITTSSLVFDENFIYFADYTQVWRLNQETGDVDHQITLPAITERRGTAYTISTIALMHQDGQLVILDKTTLNHLHTLDLGQGQYHCHMTGNKTGVAVRLVDKNAFKGAGAAGYGLYLTDEQLVKGEMPDLTPEPLAASVEKTPTEGGYNLTVTLNPELTVADFLRHLSYALWQTAYEHCTLVDAIDSTNVRLGPPDFMGTLTLNLKNAPALTDEQEQAINAIIEGAKRTMCGLGECIAQANTDDQRVVEIVVE